jgi:hypothetical protein
MWARNSNIDGNERGNHAPPYAERQLIINAAKLFIK